MSWTVEQHGNGWWRISRTHDGAFIDHIDVEDLVILADVIHDHFPEDSPGAPDGWEPAQ